MGLFGLGKVKADDVFDRGQRGSGRIVGIEVRESAESESSIRVDEYAVEVRSWPAFTAGVRQRLRPEVVRLGMPLEVRQLDGIGSDHATSRYGDAWSPSDAVAR